MTCSKPRSRTPSTRTPWSLRRSGSEAERRQKRERRTRFDKTAYHQRHLVERLVNRLKAFRRIATRYEKRAVHYLAMLTIAAIVLWL
jgi:transposase